MKYLILTGITFVVPIFALAAILKMVARARMRHQAILGKKVEKAFFSKLSIHYYSCLIKESGRQHVLEFADRVSKCAVIVRVNLIDATSITVEMGPSSAEFSIDEADKAGRKAANLLLSCAEKEKGPS
jgi:hypothetical protein